MSDLYKTLCHIVAGGAIGFVVSELILRFWS